MPKNYLTVLQGLTLITLLLPIRFFAQGTENTTVITPAAKQSLVVDYLAEGAGASTTLGFFFLDIDTDQDGLPDFYETGAGDDLDGDGLNNASDPDDDGDGIPDASDRAPVGVTSMPAYYFKNGTVAESNGSSSSDYWQYVPNDKYTTGTYSGYYKHPGAYLYIDNNSNNIPDVLEYTTGSNQMPPYVLDKGYTSSHITLGSFQGLLGNWEEEVGLANYVTGKTIFYINDDDSGTSATGDFSTYSVYGYRDSKSSTDGNVDYDIYGTTDAQSTSIPQSILGTDLVGESYYKYRWFDDIVVSPEREVVFFTNVYWGSGGSRANTYYSKVTFNPDTPYTNLTNNGSTSGDNYGSSGKNNWFPRLQNTSDHDDLAAGKFGAGTTWAAIATAPTDGSSPVAHSSVNQDWVDTYGNWQESRQVVQYINVSEWLDVAGNAETTINNRYGYDISTDTGDIIIRADNGKMAHLMVVSPDGDPNSYVIGIEDLFRGTDRDYDDQSFYVTFLDGAQVEFTQVDEYTSNSCGSGNITYEAEIQSVGVVSANNILFTENLDANVTLVSGSVTTTQGTVTSGNTSGDTSVNVNVGNLAAGDIVKIRFEVSVNSGVFPTTTSVSSQGSISGSNISTILSSDLGADQHFEPTTTDLVDFIDSEDPKITCPGDQDVYFGTNCKFTLPDYTSVTTSDNCASSITVTQSPIAGTEIASNTTVTLTADDGNGNKATCTFVVKPTDNTDPNAQALTTLTVQLDANGQASIGVSDINNGSSDNCGIDTMELDITDFDCDDVGDNTVTLTVKDVSGNESTATTTVTVEDNIKPVAKSVATLTIELDTDGKASIDVSDINDGSSDNCGIDTMELDITDFDCDDVGDNTVTLTVKDVNGNESTTTITVTVEDNIKPVAKSVSTLTVQLDVNGQASIEVADINDGSSDNCSIDTMELDITDFDCNDIGDHTVTLTVKDVNGNESTTTTTVTVEDNIKPVAKSVATLTVALDADGNVSIEVLDINDDSSDNCGIDTMELDITNFDCDDVGDHTVTLKVKDVNGNESTTTTLVTVEDNIKPIAKSVATLTVELDINGQASIDVSDIDDGSTDNCGIDTMELDITNFDCDDVGDHTVTLKVKDVNGNESTATTLVTVEDNIKPIAKSVATLTVELDINGQASIDVSDIDDGSTDNCSIDMMELDIINFDCDDVGDNTVTLTVKDVNGNESTATTTVTVEDNIKPVAKSVSTLTVQLDVNGQASIEVADINDGSSDNCGIDMMELDITDFDCDDVGANTVTLTVKDVNGNESTATTNVTVEDNIKPIAKSVSTLTVELDANGLATISTTDIDDGSSDNCGIDTMELDVADFDCDDVGDNTVTLTIKDINGNESTATTTVTVEDNIKPIAKSVSTLNVALDADGNASIEVSDIDDGSTDNCSIDIMELDITDFDCNDVGDHTVTLTVKDVNGNESTATTTVTVEDNIKPVAKSVSTLTVQLDVNGQASIEVADINDGSSDNCGIDMMELDITDFDCDDVGDHTVTLTVKDVNGNESTATTIVTVEDNVKPVAKSVATLTVELGINGQASIDVSDIDDGSSDNCGIDMMKLDVTNFDCSDVGNHTVTLTVKDVNGNESTTTTTVTVEDNIRPTILVQNITVKLDENGRAEIRPEDIDTGSFDNCGINQMIINKNVFNSKDLGDNEVEFVVVDVNGNRSSQTVIVTVVDEIPPTVYCQNVTVILDEDGYGSLEVDDIDNGSFDNAGIQKMKLSQKNFTHKDLGENDVELSVTDIAGNEFTCVAKVTVIDITPPVITLLGDDPQEIEVRVGYTELGAYTDDGSNITIDISEFKDEIGTYEIRYNAVDQSGNKAEEVIRIVEVVMPTIVPLIIYPNPTADAFRIKYPEYMQSLELYDNAGKLLRIYSKSELADPISVMELSSSVYTLKAFFKLGRYKEIKLMVE